MDVQALTRLLQETALHHGTFEAAAPPHDWWDWYAAYMAARLSGANSAESSVAADRHMDQVMHVLVQRDADQTGRR
jgi:hypothetical protein